MCLCLVNFLISGTSAVHFCLMPPSALQAYNERLPSTWHIINHKVMPDGCSAHGCSRTASTGLAAARRHLPACLTPSLT